MKKWFVIMLIIALLAFGTVIGFNWFVQQKTKEAIANMPEAVYPVTAVKLEPTNWQPTIDAIGFIEPNQGVTIANEVSGIVTSIDFENGAQVQQGDMLIQLDSEVQKANLKAQQVQLPAMKADYERLLRLYKQKSVSQQDLDNAQAKYMAMQADIASLEATINQRQIEAPFSGSLGIRSVNLGQYLQVGTNIVRLEDTSSMKLRFTVPQTQLSRIAVGQPVHIYVDAYPQDVFTGQIAAIEPAVFYQSGLIQVQARIPNADGKLRSGMFAKAAIILPELTNQLVVPQTAINFALYGNTIYIIDTQEKDGKVEKRVKQVNVNVVERNGNNALITGDLKAGDEIVTSGLVRLSNHSLVKVTENDAMKLPAQMPAL
ncbi:efflux RND transporter periplasmic adaptor subunit [Shewanella sp. GXUN23E]|uniref:efflux RND transporter periplasmic adaptor subunit n=1 Tax=Shewanella sp. GXUN23E TaxID=3422498 RepID=UPI003D7CC47B